MHVIRLVPDRWQKLLDEALKFGLVGGINTVINYAVFNALALTVFKDGQLKATVVATIVATISSYLMNRHWTFRDRPKSALRRETSLFFLFNATGLIIEVGVLAVAKYGLGMTGLLALNVAKTVGVLLATLFRFWTYRTFVFQTALTGTQTNSQARSLALGRATSVGSGPATDAPSRPAEGTETPPRPAEGTDVPLEIEFAEAISVELEAELATELNPDLASSFKSASRPAGRG